MYHLFTQCSLPYLTISVYYKKQKKRKGNSSKVSERKCNGLKLFCSKILPPFRQPPIINHFFIQQGQEGRKKWDSRGKIGKMELLKSEWLPSFLSLQYKEMVNYGRLSEKVDTFLNKISLIPCCHSLLKSPLSHFLPLLPPSLQYK